MSASRKHGWLIGAGVVVALMGVAALIALAVQPSSHQSLAIRVSGNRLVNSSGAAVTLHGVNRSGTEYSCVQGHGIFDGPSDDASIAAIASWHGVNAVRLGLNEDCWLGINGFPNGGVTTATYHQAIADYVARLHAHGLYAILELHWSAPGTFPATSQEGMPDADHSPAFWASVAAAFKGDRGTIFDLFNEPAGVDWKCWQNGCAHTGTVAGRGTWQAAGMQSLVTAVRNAGADNVVMLGGLSFANDMTGWLTYGPSDSQHQLVASLHAYNFNPCHDSGCWDSQVAPVAVRVPVIAGEIGENDGQAGFINAFMAWAEPKGISYLAWTWDTWGCGRAPVLISSYSGAPCPGYGVGYKSHTQALR
jgi:endoglucanase